jgi:hypothetical protein
VRDRRDHDDAPVIHGGYGARRYARRQHGRRHAVVAEEVAQQIDGNPAVGDHRNRPGRPGQAGQEFPQPRPGLPR